MMVYIEKVGEDIPDGADYAVYRVGRHEAMIISKKLDGGWERTGRLYVDLLWQLVDGWQVNEKAVWDLDNQRFIAGTKRQKSFVPEPKPVIVEERREPKNRHLIDRNWSMWRMRNEQGMTFTQIARQFNVTPSRVRELVVSCDRRVRNAVLFKNDPEGFDRRGIRDALLGVEIVCRQGETPYLMFENEKRLDFY